MSIDDKANEQAKSKAIAHGDASHRAAGAPGWGISRRSLIGAGALLGMAALMQPSERAFAWSSWTNATSSALKHLGMGDCVHEDLVQVAYARVLRNHANDETQPNTLLNPWAGVLQSDQRYAAIAEDTVDIGEDRTFKDDSDLATRLFRENLAYLRIGSFWNDAAANTLADFAYSCYYADSVPKFSGADHYQGAWDVGQHIWETNEQNKTYAIGGLDALVQFTMNDRNNFIHGMLTSTASHAAHLRQSEVKAFALQWLGVAYEYARTGEVQATSDVTQEQAQKIFKGFIDTYGQLDEQAQDMRVSLKVSASEASIKLPRRRLRLRALGMMCHTMEDLWCPAHTCRTYYSGGSVPQNSILAFCNYKLQNGNKAPMFGYHIPFDRYATSDSGNSTNWREALTRGDSDHVGTETLAHVLDDTMGCLAGADAYFNTLGMNETVACITQLLEYLYVGTAWDDGVRAWVDAQVMPTYFDGSGQSYVCDAGRRSLHTPTYLITPLQSMKRAYRKAGLAQNHVDMIEAARSFDAWQRGAHLFYSGKYNTDQSKYVTTGDEGASIWADAVGEARLASLVEKIHEGYSSLESDAQAALLSSIGCNGCHDMVGALGMIGGMLQEFNIDLRGSLRSGDETVMTLLAEAQAFFKSGLNDQGVKVETQSSQGNWLLGVQTAFADEGDESYATANMALKDYAQLDDGSYLIAVRDMDSLETSVMSVPTGTSGIEKLEEGLADLTITYGLETEFDDDLDYCYVVTEIDYSDSVEGIYLVTGTVASVSADGESLVLDLNGISELELAIGSTLSNVPAVGDYICARYSVGASSLDLVGYDQLDAPGTLTKATYPVAKVAGSSVWLLTSDADSNATDGYRAYLQVDYGAADVRAVPREGYYATVYYHDEAYGDVTGVDENALATASAAAGFRGLSTQSSDDELTDSADTPGYLDLGDEYDDLNYGNEVFHVANVVVGTDEKADDTPSGIDDDPVPEPTPADPTSSDTGSTGASTAAATKASSAATPKAGDPLPGVGGVLSMAAVAGAALAAYSARRVENEKK